MLKKVDIYCDGSCCGNPGMGGYGAVLVYEQHEKEIHGSSNAVTTNNKMEIVSVIMALRALKYKCDVTVYTDSNYVVNTMNGVYKRRTNHELWSQLDVEVAKQNVKFVWVRGHSGNEYNERADKLAKLGWCKNE